MQILQGVHCTCTLMRLYQRRRDCTADLRVMVILPGTLPRHEYRREHGSCDEGAETRGAATRLPAGKAHATASAPWGRYARGYPRRGVAPRFT